MVVVLECIARTEPGTGLHNFIRILDLWQRIELERLQLAHEITDLGHPVVVQVVPIHEVMAGTIGEVRNSLFDRRFICRHRRQVPVTVEDPERDAIGWWHLQVAGVVLR